MTELFHYGFIKLLGPKQREWHNLTWRQETSAVSSGLTHRNKDNAKANSFKKNKKNNNKKHKKQQTTNLIVSNLQDKRCILNKSESIFK